MSRKHLALLLLIAIAAVLVHGYHPAVEDGEIYLPGIKKDLNPALYPVGAEFFMSHARMTLFDELIAGSVRISHIPFDYAVFLWHFGCVFVFLAACWRVGRQCFTDSRAPWGGTLLVAALLTIPVAGTSLYILDQYLTTRDLSTAGIMLVVANALERRFVRAGVWIVLIAVIHPLMAVFGAGLLGILFLQRHATWKKTIPQAAGTGVALLVPLLPRFQPVSKAYREVLETRSYFFVVRWEWYEWLGIAGTLVLLWWLARYAKRQALHDMEALCRALIIFELMGFAAALVLCIPGPLANFALLQPMRCLHLVFIIMFVLLGGLLAESVLKNHVWRWLLLFVPLAAVMFLVQRDLFPATEHLELPGRAPRNPWVQAFLWIRKHTPQDALFALDPDHMALPGEDQHGFRALAERSMLADALKDSGAVSMFPALADRWKAQVTAQQDWKHFQAADFARLRRDWGVTWVVLQRPANVSLSCPFENSAVMVCKLE